MRKQIMITALGILMMASAFAMYAGDTMTFETNLTNPVYTVVGNSSDLIGLNVSFENGTISISPVLNYKPDNFTLIFFDNLTREVEKIVYRGGGKSRIKYVDKNVTVYVPEYIYVNETVVEIVNETEPKTQEPETQEGTPLWGKVVAVGLIIIGLMLLFGDSLLNLIRKL